MLILGVFTIILGIFTRFLVPIPLVLIFTSVHVYKLLRITQAMEWEGKLRLTTSSGKWVSRLAASLHSLKDENTRICNTYIMYWDRLE